MSLVGSNRGIPSPIFATNKNVQRCICERVENFRVACNATLASSVLCAAVSVGAGCGGVRTSGHQPGRGSVPQKVLVRMRARPSVAAQEDRFARVALLQRLRGVRANTGPQLARRGLPPSPAKSAFPLP